MYKFRFKNLITGLKREVSANGEENFSAIDCQRVLVQLSFVDGDDVNFMDVTDFSQYSLQRQDIEDQMAYLIDGLEDITALLINDQIAAIELPQSVALKIVETTPAVKGASASARTKPATLETGLMVQVPEYITSGEVIKINTTNAKFMARA